MTPMEDFEIIRTEAEGSGFLDQLSKAVDDNKDAFGFVARSLYPARLRAGGLWILVKGNDYAGHLMFGGALPTLKIQQLFILPSYRKHGLGHRLIDDLVDYAELEGYSSIRARVAADLPANAAWERLGFETRQTVRGGITTGRIINVRLRRIHPRGAQMHMLSILDGTAERDPPIARGLPINRSHWYTLDMNVWLDFIRRREPFYDAAHALIEAATKGHFRLRFTSEAVEEARRNASGRLEDPLLEITTSLQALPHVNEEDIFAHIEDLRGIVFPGRPSAGRHFANEQSDLRHLALSIHQGASGFITRDRAVLRHRRQIWSRFGLDVLNPTDLIDDEAQLLQPRIPLAGNFGVERVEQWQSAAEEFAKAAIGEGARLRRLDHDDEAWTCSLAGRMIGLCYWHTQTRGDTEAFLCTAEIHEADARQRAFDVLLGLLFSISRSTAVFHRVVLRIDEGTAESFGDDLLRLGFFKTKEVDTFIRFASGAPLDLGDWQQAKDLFEQEIGAASEWIKAGRAGPVLRLKRKLETYDLSRFEIETRFGVTALTLGEREAFYLPIQERHSNELLPLPRRPELFTSHDTAFRQERVYFRSPRSADKIEPGHLLFLYVSGVIGGLLGVARCTASQVLDHGEASERYRRLAVLDPSEIGKRVHCIAFDNYLPFKTPLTLDWLKSRGLEAKNNFITIARVPCDPQGAGYLDILAEGLERR